jgi:hypothetical protein
MEAIMPTYLSTDSAERDELEYRNAIAELERILAKYERLGIAELAPVREELDRLRREYPNLSEH